MKQGLKYVVFALLILWLPAACTKQGVFDSVRADPRSVFEETWRVIDERYALFPEKKINWDSVRSVYQDRFVPEMSEQSMFTEITRMLETLRDGHVTLISPFDTSTYAGFYTGYPRNFSLEHVINNYLTPGYRQQGPFLYDIRENVGYIYYGQFSSQLDLADLTEVMKEMAGTKGLILDIRNNTGGFVQAAERMAAAFSQESILVKYEQYKLGKERNSFTDPVPRRLSPEGIYYAQPVIVLTNRACFSACNDFVMYTRAMQQIRQYGDQTGGGGSIPSTYQLANGWYLRFSATRTLSPSLQSVEMGLLPDKKIEITVLDDLRGADPILESAFIDLR
jgi:C-terminal processing protease CtpA/Prc